MQTLEQLKNHALSLMKAGGFPVTKEIDIEVDEKLPFMGYTTERNGKSVIVVAKWAQNSGMLSGLLIHELSHIYRIQSNHPSHNSALQNKALSIVLSDTKLMPYQQDILLNILNSIMDLYADDLFFQVRKDAPVNLSDFFLDWIKKPVEGTDAKSTWINAGNMVSAAFAQANLERHYATDTDGKIKKGVADFLSHIDPRIAKKFDYFKNLMVNLPEKITNEEFGKLLVDYLHTFLSMVEH